jgi:hypothetical protein
VETPPSLRGSVRFCSSVGVSAMPMCPRLADGHLNSPRSALLYQPKSNLGLQQKFMLLSGLWGPGLMGCTS